MSHSVTWSCNACRSNEWVLFGINVASFPVPQPKSAMIWVLGMVLTIQSAIRSTGFCFHNDEAFVNPVW